MKAFLSALFLISNTALASSNGYDLKVNLSLNGKSVASPHFVLKKGEPAEVTQNNESGRNFINVVATEGSVLGREGIMLKFVVGTIDKNGARTIISRPQILASEDVAAQFTSNEEKGASTALSLSVIAKRTAF